MLALRKRRMAAAAPFLRGGFRPFFFGAASWALIAIALWLAVLAGAIRLEGGFDEVAWHRHEMLFGFVGAAIAGFLLTAIPNWTGRLPIAGRPLLALFGLWTAARLALLFPSPIGFWAGALLDIGLFGSLALLAGREVIASGNRNMPIVGLLLLFGLADAADYCGAAGLVPTDVGWRAAHALIVIMISTIGGRIVPSFTRNWIAKHRPGGALPTQPQALDRLVIASTAIALLFWIAFASVPLTGAMLILSAAAQLLRLSRWSPVRAAADPLVLVLHVGYLWVPTGLLLLGLSIVGTGIAESAGIHALTAGAMSTMILAVMTRASLGHTGRELKASAMTVAAYACVTAGAIIRVAASLGLGGYREMLAISGTLWGAAFLLFLVGYGPILCRPRLGGE